MFDAIAALFSSFLAICRFRLAPQDLPSSIFLLRASIGLYFFVGFLLTCISLPPVSAFILSLTDTCFMVGFTLIGLRIFNLNIRATQTLIAQAGTGVLLTLAFIPLVATQSPAPEVADSFDIRALLHYLLLVWSLLIQGHIFRHAFSISWTVGVIVALINYWMQFTLLDAVNASLVHL